MVEVGGELFGAELVDEWAPRTRLLNAYGPTECTVCVTTSDTLAPGEPITLGGPVPGSAVRAVVLDGWMRPVPDGGEGELYLSGPCLARGYRGQSARTSERFVANPFGRQGRACTAPATWCGAPARVDSNTWGAPTSRSRYGDCASRSGTSTLR